MGGEADRVRGCRPSPCAGGSEGVCTLARGACALTLLMGPGVVGVRTHKRACNSMRTHVCMHARMQLRMHTHVHACAHAAALLHAQVHTCMSACRGTHARTDAHACMHAHDHIHTHN